MMRWIVLVPVLLLLVLFTLSNRQEVRLGLWPLDVSTAAPLWLMVLGVGGAFFLLGALMVWAANLPLHRRLREMQRTARLVEAELVGLRAQKAELLAQADPASAAANPVPMLLKPNH